MTTEDYVSLEVAELLKEKGFDEYCRFVYNAGVLRSVASLDCHWNEGYGELIEEKQNSDFGKYDNAISAPTLQMARKWLEEKKRLYVNVWAEPKDAENDDFRIVYRLQVFDGKTNYGTFEFPSREKACEAGIRFCLENLI